jgi:D-alanyl-D-alanine carboxypeptidase
MGPVTSGVRRRAFGACVVAACLFVGCTASSTDSGGALGGAGAGADGAADALSTVTSVASVTTSERSEPVPTSTRASTTTSSTIRSTTTTEAPLTGWDATDAHLRRRLIGNGDTAASFAISIGGELVHTVAMGVRSLDESDAAEPTDRFRIASISKTISAITLLQLVEEGVVGLDDPVGGVVAATLGVEAVPGGTADITVRQLLTHTSGFAQYENLFFGRQVDSCHDAATVGFTRGLQGAPGAGFRYSNMNYCVAGLLIEALSGQSYEQAVYERVLTPLGIFGMRLAPTYDPGPDEVDHLTVIGRNYMEVLGGAGAWVATPADLVTIIDALDPAKPGWKPLDASTLAVMQTSVTDPLVPDRGYGLGLILYGGGAYGHTGTIESTHAMVLDRNDGVSWALTVSGEYPSETGELAGIVDDALVAGGFIAGAPLVVD